MLDVAVTTIWALASIIEGLPISFREKVLNLCSHNAATLSCFKFKVNRIINRHVHMLNNAIMLNTYIKALARSRQILYGCLCCLYKAAYNYKQCIHRLWLYVTMDSNTFIGECWRKFAHGESLLCGLKYIIV